MPIIVSQNGKNAKKLDKISFGLENKIQQYIYDNPESIPLYDIREDIQLLILAREFSTNSGPIDAVGIDQDGQIYLVETKLYKNPDKRTVIAQVIDYGASLWRTLNDFDAFILQLNSHVQKKFNMSTTDKIQEFFALDDEQMQSVLEQMKFNLDEGNFKFVVMMDSLEDRLKDLIVYMNQNSKFDIYGVEMEYYQHDTFEIMIPKIYGAQVKKDVKVSVNNSVRSVWNHQTFTDELKNKLSTDNFSKVIKLLTLCENSADSIKWGTGSKKGSFSPIINALHTSISPFTFYTDGSVQIKFSWLKSSTISEDIFNKIVEEFYQTMTTTSLNISKEDLLAKQIGISLDELLTNFETLYEAVKKSL